MPKKNITRLTVGAIATNCWIYPLDDNGTAALIDPGAEADRIISALEKLSLVPRFILLTHGHFDHIAALKEVAAAFRPIIAIHRLDAEYLGPDSRPVHCRSFAAAAGDSSYIDAFWNEPPPADCLLEEGGTIGPFTVLHLPGHTPGSIALWDREAETLFTGDTLFEGDYGRTDLPGGDEEQIAASLRRLFAMDGNTGVYPGHGQITSIGREAKRGMV
ncbi:MAG: MBL fold metallo-hydrolase [Treponema sp.]|jgi:glyoxylase-like metal-dependent hydrolase (beta-lactamase superfamily II)|nr:MBL fold metallo-hydrolase [Treponema sp.]